MATPAQIAANQRNALLSRGPNTVEGKEASRRNALKHGLTGGGVVIPGEDEHEVAVRVATLEQGMGAVGDVLTTLLLRQVAIGSIRVERAYRNETALAAERMRKAVEVWEDERLVLAQTILADLPIDPVTTRRRLLKAPEGIDALVGRLRALLDRAAPDAFIAWDQEEGTELDLCMGKKPGQGPASVVEMLTRGIVYDHWVGLDPAAFAELDDEARRHWAVGEIRTIIEAEVAHLADHCATLDLDRFAADRAEAAERAMLDLGTAGTTLRRYAGAAERTMLKVLKEIRIFRYEARVQSMEPAQAAEFLATTAAEMPALKEVTAELGSFCRPTSPPTPPTPGRVVQSNSVDQNAPEVPRMVDLAPPRPVPPGS